MFKSPSQKSRLVSSQIWPNTLCTTQSFSTGLNVQVLYTKVFCFRSQIWTIPLWPRHPHHQGLCAVSDPELELTDPARLDIQPPLPVYNHTQCTPPQVPPVHRPPASQCRENFPISMRSQWRQPGVLLRKKLADRKLSWLCLKEVICLQSPTLFKHSDHLIVFLNVSPANLWNKHKWSLWQQSQVRNAKPNLGPELVTKSWFCQACFCLFNYNHLRNQFFHNFNLMRGKCSFQLAIDPSLLCHIPFLPDNNRVDSDRVLICTDNIQVSLGRLKIDPTLQLTVYAI